MRRMFLFTLAALMLMIVFGCGKKEEDHTAENQAAYVSGLIDEIGEVSYTSLSAINRAENFYKVLTDEQKALVANADILTAARASYNALTSVLKQGNETFDRSKLQIGTYCYRESLWNDADMQMLADADVDYICGAANNKVFLDLCEKYGIGAIIHYLPWGVNPEEYEGYVATYVDHPAIWAFELVDEPSSAVFSDLGAAVEKAKELFPEKMIYTCLFPNYASTAQLYTDTYAAHIDGYIKSVDTDFINYDHYMYPGYTSYFLDNIEIVADACRKNGRDLWIVIQASSSRPEYFLNAAQIEVQAYLSLAYGAKAINWACWTAGWWHPDNQIVDSKGNYTSLYYGVKAANSEIKAFSDAYSEYVNINTFYAGRGNNSNFLERTAVTAVNAFKQDVFTEIAIKDGGLVAGYFEKPDGSGYGLMLVNVSDITSGETYNAVSFKVHAATKVTLHTDGSETVLIPDENGVYSFVLNSCGGAFITVERNERTALDSITNLLGEEEQSAYNLGSIEFGASIMHAGLDAALVSKLNSAGIGFVIGNATEEALKLLKDKDMGIFAANFTEYITPAYSSLYGFAPAYTTGAVSVINNNIRFEDNGFLFTVTGTPSEIKQFAAKVDLEYVNPYIHSIFGNSGKRDILSMYFTTLNNAAKAVAENGKTLYITVQTSDMGNADLITPTADEIKWQIWNAFAFGAKKVILSDYTAMTDETLAEVGKTITEIKAFKDNYANYTFETAYGCAPDEKYSSLGVMAGSKGMPEVTGITALSAEKSALFGIFEKTDGTGKALVIVPCDTASTLGGEEITYTATITLDGTQKKVTLYQNGTATELTGSGNVYTVTLTTFDGVFITIE